MVLKNLVGVVAIWSAVLILILSGCGREKSEEKTKTFGSRFARMKSAEELIKVSKSMKASDEEKVVFLIEKGEVFYGLKEFQEALDIATYILKYVDKSSPEAKDLFEKARTKLATPARR